MNSNHDVLVVEDNHEWANLLGHCLTSLEFTFVKVATKHDALAELAKRKFAVAIVDLKIPNGHNGGTIDAGLDVVRWINEHSHSTAALVVSVVEETDIITAALDAGAQAYITKKDFRVECFAKKMEQCVTYYRKLEEWSGNKPAIDKVEDSVKSMSK
jgi:CheY-like chemotaxis protein